MQALSHETKMLRRLLFSIGFKPAEVVQLFRGATTQGVTFIDAATLARYMGTDVQFEFDRLINEGQIETPYNHDDGLTVVFTAQGRSNYA